MWTSYEIEGSLFLFLHTQLQRRVPTLVNCSIPMLSGWGNYGFKCFQQARIANQYQAVVCNSGLQVALKPSADITENKGNAGMLRLLAPFPMDQKCYVWTCPLFVYLTGMSKWHMPVLSVAYAFHICFRSGPILSHSPSVCILKRQVTQKTSFETETHSISFFVLKSGTITKY